MTSCSTIKYSWFFVLLEGLLLQINIAGNFLPNLSQKKKIAMVAPSHSLPIKNFGEKGACLRGHIQGLP